MPYSFLNKKFSLKYIDFKDFYITIILFFVILILLANIHRAISNAYSNHLTYSVEINNYEQLKKRNLELKNDLEYYKSDEFKKIFLRESLLLAEEGDKIFITRGKPEFIQEKKIYYKIDNLDHNYFWLLLLHKYFI